MYAAPDMNNATDRFAHMLSEMHNDRAPIGWERYRSLANLLMMKFPIKDIVCSDKFFDPDFQPGRTEKSAAPREKFDPSADASGEQTGTGSAYYTGHEAP